MDSRENITRCGWCGEDELYVRYHDQQWGKPSFDDRTLFEFMLLEGAQAGLSWITVLRKREGYRKAFDGFDPLKVAEYTSEDIERLMHDESIVRNRLKILSAVKNASVFNGIVKEKGSFDNYIREFLPDGQLIVNHRGSLSEIPVSNAISDNISKDLHKRGVRFFGTVICYSFLQAVGYINDHLNECNFKYK